MSLLTIFSTARTKNPFGQFGQPAATTVSTWGGKTACGQTSVQSIVYAFRRVIPTHDAISRIIGYWRPAAKTGTSAEQLAKALGRWKLPYQAAYRRSFRQLVALSVKGPVIIVVWYPAYPNWAHYRKVTRPKPWASPLDHAGANQWPKPAIRHWTVLGGLDAGIAVTFEPNHHSAARPERVPLDRVSLAALEAAYIAGGRIAVIPTRSIT